MSLADSTATSVNGIVIRPGMLYGKSGSFISTFVLDAALAADKGQTFEAVGNQDSRLTTVHADDLAHLYVRVAERVSCFQSLILHRIYILTT
jgi:nucleoside-diphosphate-sugar epimerase